MTEQVTNAVWRPVRPAEALDWMAPLSAPWWIAGGWALDLFLGHVTRRHGDIDIGIFRSDAPSVCATLSDSEIFEAQAGLLKRLERRTVSRKAVNSLWCRRRGECVWTFEIMLDEGGGDTWRFRRNHEIERSFANAIHQSSEGIPYLAPEIQLLYKSKEVRPNDQIDFKTLSATK